MTTSSRMTYAFARDGGLPFSRFFSKVHPRLGQPLYSLILAATLAILFGLILIGSSSAFNALISASVVALGVSYAIPVAINLCRGRKMLGPRAFVLPGPLGWIANIVGVSYTIVTTVLFLFPPELPVSTSNMSKYIRNYKFFLPILSCFQTTALSLSALYYSSAHSNGSLTDARISLGPGQSWVWRFWRLWPAKSSLELMPSLPKLMHSNKPA